MASVLLLRPANDAVAIELSGWAATLKSCSTPHQFTDLTSASATRAAVDAGLPVHDLTTFFGHGAPSRLRGSPGDLVDATNVGSASRKAIIAIACSSADILGRTAISQGVAAYLGFTRKLTWLSGDPDTQFQPAFCAAPLALLNCLTMAHAETDMFTKLEEVVDYYDSGAGNKSPNAAIGYLSAFGDLHHINLHGDGTYAICDETGTT